MNRTPAIDRYLAQLTGIVAVLLAWAGLQEGDKGAPITRAAYQKIMRVLLPAESALRRLIVLAAEDVKAGPAGRKMPEAVKAALKKRLSRSGERVGAFPLFDPRLSLRQGRVPRITAQLRISCLDQVRLVPVERVEKPLNPKAVTRRVRRLEAALSDLPKQARRLARWRAAHHASLNRPIRPGRPPGYRERPIHAVDILLKDIQQRALWALRPPDTS